MKFKNTEDGFTLIELLVVILVIGILAAIAIPVFLNQRRTASESSIKADLTNAAKTIEAEATSNKGKYPTAMPADVKTSSGVTLSLIGAEGSPPPQAVTLKTTSGLSLPIQFRINANKSSADVTTQIPEASVTVTYYFDYEMRCANTNGSTTFSALTYKSSSVSNSGSIVWGNTLTCSNSGILTSLVLKPSGTAGSVNTLENSITLTNTATPIAKQSFCIQGTHDNVPNKTWKYDSLNGGLVEGSC